MNHEEHQIKALTSIAESLAEIQANGGEVSGTLAEVLEAIQNLEPTTVNVSPSMLQSCRDDFSFKFEYDAKSRLTGGYAKRIHK